MEILGSIRCWRSVFCRSSSFEAVSRMGMSLGVFVMSALQNSRMMYLVEVVRLF